MTDDRREELEIHLTPEQLAAAEALAAEEGLSLEEWIKRAADATVRRDRIARRLGMDPRSGWWPGLAEDG